VLAVSGNQQVHFFDLATGKKITSVFAPAAGAFMKDLAWVSDEHVLVGGSELIHAPSQALVWTYQHDADQVRQFGGRTWYFFDDRAHARRALVPFALPHPGVTAVKETDLVLKPGDKVSFELEIMVDLANAAESDSQSAADALKRALQVAGYEVVDDAPNRLVARTSSGETKEVNYQTFGINRESHKMSVTTRVYELALYAGDQLAWSRQSVQSPPMHIMLRENETVDQAVDREMLPKMSYFGSAVPSRVLKPELAEKRTSRLSISGIE
jgi:hypothetical protein